MLKQTIEDLNSTQDIGEVKYGAKAEIEFILPEEFVRAKGTCGCTATHLKGNKLSVLYNPKKGEVGKSNKKTINLFRLDGTKQALKFTVKVV